MNFLEKLTPNVMSDVLLGTALPTIRADVDHIYRMFDLERTIRFFGQYHWEAETREAGIQPGELPLENVAAHTFQVASSVQFLAPHFSKLNKSKAIELALLHDHLEIYTGDKDPVGTDGQGLNTHAFNTNMRRKKLEEERLALEQMLNNMRVSMRVPYQALMEDMLHEQSSEARFVKAVDKLQALAFVRLKKVGRFTPGHVAFTIRYSRLGVENFPELNGHFMLMFSDLLEDVRRQNQCDLSYFCDAVNRSLAGVDGQLCHMPKRVALIGKSGAGKSTVANLLQLHCGTSRISTGAICRKLSYQLFGDEAKSSTQRIDDALTALDPSIFLNAALLGVDDDSSFCIDALRFQSDLDIARKRDFVVVKVIATDNIRFSRLKKRGQIFDPDSDGTHRSETELDSAQVDFTIENIGDIAALEQAVRAICPVN